jgi:hypothetical protein
MDRQWRSPGRHFPDRPRSKLEPSPFAGIVAEGGEARQSNEFTCLTSLVLTNAKRQRRIQQGRGRRPPAR